MGARYSLEDVEKLKNNKIFFDANILIYMFCSSLQHEWEYQYASLANELYRGYKLVLNVSVISEFVNRVVRIEHKKYQETNERLSFKSYRNSNAGKTELKNIYTLLKETILPFFEVSTNEYTMDVVESFLEVDNLDFGDKIIEYTCKNNGYILLTNDGDFKNSDVDILSSNPVFF